MITTRSDGSATRQSTEDPARYKVLIAIVLVCVTQIVASVVPILGSIVARVTIALAASCLGWMVGGPIDAATARRRAICGMCAKCRAKIDETISKGRRDDGRPGSAEPIGTDLRR